MTTNVEDTLPWSFTGAYEAIGVSPSGKPYHIGAVISEKLGCVMVALSYDGKDQEVNKSRLQEVGEFIIKKVNS